MSETPLQTPEKFKNKSQYTLFQRLWRYINIWDGIWSIPLAITLFLSVGFIGQSVFGQGFGFYDPTFIQAVTLSSMVLVMFNFTAWFMMYFNFRDLWKYYIRYSKDEFGKLQPWQKITVLLFLYCFFMVVQLALLSKLI